MTALHRLRTEVGVPADVLEHLTLVERHQGREAAEELAASYDRSCNAAWWRWVGSMRVFGASMREALRWRR